MDTRLYLKAFFSLIIIGFFASSSNARSDSEIYGRVFEDRSGEPLIGVSI